MMMTRCAFASRRLSPLFSLFSPLISFDFTPATPADTFQSQMPLRADVFSLMEAFTLSGCR
jgi:hypothetical protein